MNPSEDAMTTTDLVELRELVAKLTEGCEPGPWHGVESGDKAMFGWWLDNPAGDSSFPDPDDVATMLNALPRLLDLAERALDHPERLTPTAEPGLDAAWREAEAALPEGMDLSLHKLKLPGWAEAVAGDPCDRDRDLSEPYIAVQADTPTAALQALAAALREQPEKEQAGG